MQNATQAPGETPRPEYPRPQFVRRDWQNLNGLWEFAFDDSNCGLAERWHDGRVLPKQIVVPFPYQTKLSGIEDKGVHQVVWYARTFEVPAVWLSGDLLLHFGAVDYRTTVWVNGKEVGHNRGGHVPFGFNVAPYMKEGANRVTLRVEDSQDPHQPRGKQSSSGQPHGIDYYCSTGIWQSVWLEPVPRIRIESLRITPLFEVGAFELLVFLHAPATGWTVQAEVLDGGTVVTRAEGDTPRAVVRLMLRLPDPKPWSARDPHLYDVNVRLLSEGRVLDEVNSYTGLRSVELRNGKLILNGEPTYLALVLDQGYWPESYLAPPSDDALRADVEWTKRFGFNGARKHQKIEDPRWLYWCDKLGLLVWGEMPNARAWSPEAEELLVAEWERAVGRDYNHPCIIAWVPVNESMGFPHLREGHPGQRAFLERIVEDTRCMDPTRPVIDNDGWEHTDVTDILAVHDYSHTAEALRARYAETLAGGPLPDRIWTGSRAIFAPGAEYHGQPVMLTEVGGLLIQTEVPSENRDRLYEVYASFKTTTEVQERYADIMEGIADLPFVSGFCYTQLTDVEQEINGLLTYDRHPKVDPEAIRAIHERLFGVQKTTTSDARPPT
jgi:beta-galactosidase/beta-glucuronidase